MTDITLTTDQWDIVRRSASAVRVLSPQGDLVATVEPELTPAEIEQIKREIDSSDETFTAEHVRNTLSFLEDAWQKEGGFGKERMRELVAEFDAKEKR